MSERNEDVLDQLRDAAVGTIPTIPPTLVSFAPDAWEAAGLPRNFSALSPEQRFVTVFEVGLGPIDKDAPKPAVETIVETDDQREERRARESEETERENAKIAADAEAEAEQARAEAAAAAPAPNLDPALSSGGFDQPEPDSTDDGAAG